MITKIDAALPTSFPTSVRAGNTVARGTAPAIPVDTVDISDAARSRQLADADTRGQWEGALAMQRSGVPQLINVGSAIKGGMDDMQIRMQQWLTGQGFDADTRFSLSYDAANKSFRIESSPEVKAALEVELNSTTPSPSATAIREGYAQLEDLSSGLDSARKQFALDQSAGGHDIASRQQGFAYSFALVMQAGMLSANLTPLRVKDSVANSHELASRSGVYAEAVKPGASRGIHFPPRDAPQAVVEAWNTATQGMDEGDRMTYAHIMHSYIHGISIGDGPATGGMPVNSIDSYRAAVGNYLDMLERMRGQLPTGQYENSKPLFTELQALLE